LEESITLGKGNSAVLRRVMIILPPLSDKSGGLNGSLQHLVKAFLEEPWKLILLAGVNTKQNKSPV